MHFTMLGQLIPYKIFMKRFSIQFQTFKTSKNICIFNFSRSRFSQMSNGKELSQNKELQWGQDSEVGPLIVSCPTR